MTGFLSVTYIVVCSLLIILILLQPGKGGGMGAIGGGGGNTMFGARGSVGFLGKLTGWLGAMFMVLSLILAAISIERSGLKEDKPVDETADGTTAGTESGSTDGDATKDGNATKSETKDATPKDDAAKDGTTKDAAAKDATNIETPSVNPTDPVAVEPKDGANEKAKASAVDEGDAKKADDDKDAPPKAEKPSTQSASDRPEGAATMTDESPKKDETKVDKKEGGKDGPK